MSQNEVQYRALETHAGTKKQDMTNAETMDDIVKRLCVMEAPLSQRLAEYSAALRTRQASSAAAYDDLARRLAAAKAFSGAPDVGDIMPAFALPDSKGQVHKLGEILAKGPLVISFNRGHWCPYCTVELNALKQGLSRIAATGAQVVSIMPDMPEYIAKVADDIGGAFPVLSDANNGYALSLDLVMWLGEEIRSLDHASDFSLQISQHNNAYFVPIPATFVVASNGKVGARFLDPDFRNRMEIDDIIAALQKALI